MNWPKGDRKYAHSSPHINADLYVIYEAKV